MHEVSTINDSTSHNPLVGELERKFVERLEKCADIHLNNDVESGFVVLRTANGIAYSRPITGNRSNIDMTVEKERFEPGVNLEDAQLLFKLHFHQTDRVFRYKGTYSFQRDWGLYTLHDYIIPSTVGSRGGGDLMNLRRLTGDQTIRPISIIAALYDGERYFDKKSPHLIGMLALQETVQDIFGIDPRYYDAIYGLKEEFSRITESGLPAAQGTMAVKKLLEDTGLYSARLFVYSQGKIREMEETDLVNSGSNCCY